MKKKKNNILGAFEGLKASENFNSEVISMATMIENLTFNSNPDEISSALDEFSEKYPRDAKYIRENHPAFFANVDVALSKKHWDVEYIKIRKLMMEKLNIKLFITY